MKILFLDIETSPILADVWGLWKNNVGLNQIRKNGTIISWCAKWAEEDVVYYADLRTHTEKELVGELVSFINEADAVVGHNGDRYDIPWIRGRCLVHGIPPVAPVRQIDTLKIAKANFRFASNKLAHLADILGCSPKRKHEKFPGHELWTECMNGNVEAWEEMEAYNIQDVIALEEIFDVMRPWAKGLPNVGVYNGDDEPVCPKCGGKHVHKRGFAYTNLSKFQRYRCTNCGGWSRGRTNLLTKEERKALLANVA